jgi:hypothetical protein
MIKLLRQQLVVPDFMTFCDDLSALALLASPDTSGKNADYIPPLRCAPSCLLLLHAHVHPQQQSANEHSNQL